MFVIYITNIHIFHILYIHGIHYTTAGALKVFQATALRILLQAMPCLSRMALAAMKASSNRENGGYIHQIFTRNWWLIVVNNG